MRSGCRRVSNRKTRRELHVGSVMHALSWSATSQVKILSVPCRTGRLTERRAAALPKGRPKRGHDGSGQGDAGGARFMVTQTLPGMSGAFIKTAEDAKAKRCGPWACVATSRSNEHWNCKKVGAVCWRMTREAATQILSDRIVRDDDPVAPVLLRPVQRFVCAAKGLFRSLAHMK